MAALFVAAPGRFDVARLHGVHPNNAGAEVLDDVEAFKNIAGPDRGGQAVGRVIGDLERVRLARCDPAYISATEALGSFPPADPTKYHGYDKWVEDFFDLHLADRERVREYGMLNYGDWYDTAWDSWGNLEYDLARICFVQYLRTGDRRYFDRAEQASRHFMDVDVINAVNPILQKIPASSNAQPGQVWFLTLGLS